MKIRVGFGFDVHQLVEGRELWLGGIRLGHSQGLLGNSDGAVILHKGSKIMTDVFDDKKRSEIMSRVRSKNNKSTELKLIQIFKENGITGWRRNYKVKGHPDFVFLDKKIAIFVDGCFWHGHDCRNTRPADNADYWIKKRERNMKHDQEITALFEQRGWTVIRIWECEFKKKKRESLLKKLAPCSKNANQAEEQ